jgi:hypothetical protein
MRKNGGRFWLRIIFCGFEIFFLGVSHPDGCCTSLHRNLDRQKYHSIAIPVYFGAL